MTEKAKPLPTTRRPAWFRTRRPWHWGYVPSDVSDQTNRVEAPLKDWTVYDRETMLLIGWVSRVSRGGETYYVADTTFNVSRAFIISTCGGKSRTLSEGCDVLHEAYRRFGPSS